MQSVRCPFKKCDGTKQVYNQETGKFKRCMCYFTDRANKIYQSSFAPEKYMKYMFEWETSFPIETQNGNKTDAKSLLLSIKPILNQLIEDNVRLFFVGNKGCGKTSIAASIALHAALWESIPSLFIDERVIKDYIFSSEKKALIREQAKHAKILIIDDLGADSYKQGDRLQEVISEMDTLVRHHSGLVIVTSNKRPENMEQLYDETKVNAGRFLSSLVTENKKTYIFKENLRAEYKSSSINQLP